jgi:hypothetical protein
LNQLASRFTPSIDTPQLIFDFFIQAVAPTPAFEKCGVLVRAQGGATAADWDQPGVGAEKPIAAAQRTVRNTVRIEISKIRDSLQCMTLPASGYQQIFRFPSG